jgi:hypothetical protein
MSPDERACTRSHSTTAADLARIAQGIEALRARLSAWMQETPSACGCDAVEVLAHTLVIAMTTMSADVPPREFQRAVRLVLAAIRTRAAELHREMRP